MKKLIRLNISRVLYVLFFIFLNSRFAYGLNEIATRFGLCMIFNLVLILISFISTVDHQRLFFTLFFGWSLVPYLYNELQTYSWYDMHHLIGDSDLNNSTKSRQLFVSWELLGAGRGDMIEFERSYWWFLCTFTHWGIYDGEGHVVHFVVDKSGIGRIQYDLTEAVAYQGLSSFSQGYISSLWTHLLDGDGSVSLVRVNNLEKLADSLNLQRRLPAEIMSNAMEVLIQQEEQSALNYNVFKQNCEHFVTNVSYGLPFSSQVDTWFNYWHENTVKDYKALFISYQFFMILTSISKIRKLALKLLTTFFTQNQLDNFVRWLVWGLDLLENAVHDNAQLVFNERIWVYLSLQLFLEFKKECLEVLAMVNRIYRRRQRAITISTKTEEKLN